MSKKLMSFLTLIVLVALAPVFAQTESASNNTSANSSQNQVSVQEQTQNQGEETQIQANVSTKEGEDVGKQQYQPKSENAVSRSDEVAKAVKGMAEVANRISNPEVGEQIRVLAREQNEAEDSVNKAIDKANERGAFAKFFIGSDYGQVKEIKKIMEQNQERIRELQQIMLKLENSADQAELQNQINILEIQNLNLKNQADDLGGGFSLFGWFIRWFYGV